MEGLSATQILDAISDGVYVISPRGDLIYVNNTAIKYSGISKETLLNSNIYEMHGSGQLSNLLLETTLKTGMQQSTQQRFFRADRPNDPGLLMLITQTPIFDGENHIIYVIGVIRYMRDIQKICNSTPGEAPSVIWQNTPDPATPIAEDPQSIALLNMAGLVASSDASVLLTGESGVGKEVWADYIHQNSPRCNKDIVKINCASLPNDLLEAELFGYVKGAFTGASATGKKGLIEQADGGTLFLDEINSMPLPVQGKLLRVLENKTIRQIGSTTEHRIDFRMIAASNEDLNELVKKKLFRQDLYYRCNIIPFHIPPLKDRKKDIQPLCQMFLQHYNQKYGTAKSFSENLLQQLETFEWRGNVRELKNFVERMVLLTDPTVKLIQKIPEPLLLHQNDFPDSSEQPAKVAAATPFYLSAQQRELPLKQQSLAFEQWLIKQTILECGSISKAAIKLGVDRSTLIRKIKRQ